MVEVSAAGRAGTPDEVGTVAALLMELDHAKNEEIQGALHVEFDGSHIRRSYSEIANRFDAFVA
jgi:hypothetical protein